MAFQSLSVFYFFLGVILQFPDLALRFYLINLGIGVAHMSAFTATLVIPWVIKPLFGFISDTWPIFGRRRIPYIILGNVVSACCWSALAFVEPSISAAQILVLVSSMATCWTDTIYDSILVILAKREAKEDHGKIQSFCWACRAVGALVAALLGGLLLRELIPADVFIIQSTIHLMIALLALLALRERQVDEGARSFCKQLKTLCSALYTPKLREAALFVFVFAATPSSYGSFFYFLVNELHFSPVLLGILTCVRHAAMLIGTWVYRRCFRFTTYRKFFTIMVIVSAVAGATPLVLVLRINEQINLPAPIFAASDDLALSVISQISLMPILVLAAKLCPTGVEASLYASFVSILNASGVLSDYTGSLLTLALGITTNDFSNLPYLILICTASTLLAVCFIGFLPAGCVADVVDMQCVRHGGAEEVEIPLRAEDGNGHGGGGGGSVDSDDDEDTGDEESCLQASGGGKMAANAISGLRADTAC